MDVRQHETSNYMHRFTCHYVISGEKSLENDRSALATVTGRVRNRAHTFLLIFAFQTYSGQYKLTFRMSVYLFFTALIASTLGDHRVVQSFFNFSFLHVSSVRASSVHRFKLTLEILKYTKN